MNSEAKDTTLVDTISEDSTEIITYARVCYLWQGYFAAIEGGESLDFDAFRSGIVEALRLSPIGLSLQEAETVADFSYHDVMGQTE